MNIKRLIARAMIGGPEPEIVKEVDQQAKLIRQDPGKREIWNQASAAVARENRAWVIPGMILGTAVQGVAAYYLRNLIEPWVSVVMIVGVNAFLWRSFCVAERR